MDFMLLYKCEIVINTLNNDSFFVQIFNYVVTAEINQEDQ